MLTATSHLWLAVQEKFHHGATTLIAKVTQRARSPPGSRPVLVSCAKGVWTC